MVTTIQMQLVFAHVFCLFKMELFFMSCVVKYFEETREDFYSRILQVMAQLGGGSANVL